MRLDDPTVREKIVIVFMVICISLLWVVKHELTNNLYFQEDYYAGLIEQINDLKKENMQLEDAYLENASFRVIDAKARATGYIETSVYY